MGVASHAPLLERERELAGASAALDAARAGRGGLVLVEGAAGIGKTALLRAVRARAADDGMLVLHARGAEMEREFAFGVVRQLVEPPLAAAGEAEREALLEGAAGVAAGLLALPGAPRPAGGGEPDPSFAVLHGLYWLLANLASARPVCLVVDDAHWADGPSLRFLTFLVPRLEELPVAALVAFRPDEAAARDDLGRAIAADPGARSLRPAPLTADGLAAMLADGLGAEPDPALAAACHRATGGSPFLAEALIGDLRDGGGQPAAEAVAAMEPRAVGRWVQARLARLPESSRRLAAAVAVLEEAGPALAADLAGLPADEAAGAADALAAAGLLADGRPLAFAHPLVRTAVHAELPGAERATAHRRAAELLDAAGADPARVAEHLMAADPGARAWAVDRLVEAAEGAARSGAPESAAAYLRRAVAEPPAPERLPGVLLRCGLAEANAGDPRWRGHLGAALETAPDAPGRIAAAMVLAHGLWRSTEIPAAVAVLDEAADGLAGQDGTDAAMRDLLEAAAIGMGVADARTAGGMAARVTRLRERVARADAPREALGAAAFASALANRPVDEVASLARRALGSEARPPRPGELPWFQQSAVALVWADRLGEARSHLDAAVAGARATGDGMLFAAAVSQRAQLALRAGDLDAAEADARTALEAADLPVPMLHRLLAVGVLAAVLIDRGAADEADTAIDAIAAAAAAGSAPWGETLPATAVAFQRGRVRMAQHRGEEGLAELLAVGDAVGRLAVRSPTYLPWRSEAALAHLALGDADAAARLAGAETALAREAGSARALGIALRAEGLVAGGERGLALLREAAAALGSSAAGRLEHARALADLGAALRRANRRAEARDPLREALDLAHRMGAHAIADRAETELRAAGAKPRRAALRGAESLTASERRVAELAATGMTNREIAQALFVTARTVEGHLTNVFAKLGVTSRAAVAGALA